MGMQVLLSTFWSWSTWWRWLRQNSRINVQEHRPVNHLLRVSLYQQTDLAIRLPADAAGGALPSAQHTRTRGRHSSYQGLRIFLWKITTTPLCPSDSEG
jgi:hypothetical protein